MHSSRMFRLAGLSLLCLSLAHQAAASVIHFDLSWLGGNQYRYEYEVTNDGSLGGAAIEGFAIDFDPALYDEASLTITSSSGLAGLWDQQLFSSFVGLPASFDALALGTGIADATSLGGFSVDFVWLGSGTPGAQPYIIYDAGTFDVLERSQTTAADEPPPPNGVPEPGSLLLLSLGLVALYRQRRG